MSAMHSKSAFLYGQIRRALQAGRYVPGQRIDPGTIAVEFNTSPTPVRFALYRLVGEGLVVDHARDGLYVPLPTEVALRDLYDWMQRLLSMACDIDVSLLPHKPLKKLVFPSSDNDIVKLTWQLFDAIAGATAHHSLHEAVKRTNDRLAPIRRAKQGMFDREFEELSELNQYWQDRHMPALKAALHGYHARRKKMVPYIVATLIERREQLH